ncbi:MAG TPA: hypothetical protein VGP14_09905 [Casimicrobiaceae bacterium]|nr:hypothetical protein [Casimicrobiaceae bacterium]
MRKLGFFLPAMVLAAFALRAAAQKVAMGVTINSMRKIASLVIAVAIAAFALPSFADNGKKIYNLQMQMVSVPPAQAAPPFTLRAVLTNEPSGNSTINSFRLSVSGLTIVGVDQPASGHATFTASSVTVVNASPIKPGKSLSVTLRVSSCGDGGWSSNAWTGSALSGQSFDLVTGHSTLATAIPCGALALGAGFTVPDSLNPDCVSGQRGYYDKDGSIPSGVLPYFVTNTLPTNAQLHFRWPTIVAQNGDPAAAFEYSVCGPGVLPEEGLDTQVAWLTDVAGNPAFIAAPDCIAPNQLPAPYGTLLGEGTIGAADTTITVNALSPVGTHGAIQHAPLPPFDIVIGTERMTVTDVWSDDGEGGDLAEGPSEFSEHETEQEVWTVTRGVGGTTAASHTPGVLVMSTPLPLLNGPPPPYGDGVLGHFVQAQMCVADQDNDEGGGHFTTLIDIGDGYVRLP